MKQLLLTSRPRFWMYTAGPFLLGITAAGYWHTFDNVWLVTLFALYFVFPANVLIYGVNDLFDGDTDALNDKKSGYESKVKDSKQLRAAILSFNTPLIILFLFLPALQTLPIILSMLGFLFFAIFYSATPIRAKAIPFVDAWFNVLYVFPGVFAFYLAGGITLAPLLFLAGWAWCIAMHAYSAIPDIHPDAMAGIKTTATVLGKDQTLLYCLGFYLTAAALTFPWFGSLSLVLGLVYASMIAWSLSKNTPGDVLSVYRWFPYVNGLVGMVLFFVTYFTTIQ